jgi:hypothetical protein
MWDAKSESQTLIEKFKKNLSDNKDCVDFGYLIIL